MAVIDKRKLASALLSKGFEEDTSGDHTKYWFLTRNGKHCGQAWTFVSNGTSSKDLNDWNIRKMAKQLKLKREDFMRLYNCPLKEKEYREILAAQGIHT